MLETAHQRPCLCSVSGQVSAEALKAAQAAINKLQSAACLPAGSELAPAGPQGPDSPAHTPGKLSKANSFPKRRNSARLATS